MLRAFMRLQKHLNWNDKIGSDTSININKIDEEASLHAFDLEL